MKDKLNIDVGERIRRTREVMNLTREDFSELCDISSSFLSAVELGNKSITTKTLYKICSSCNISANYILFGNPNKNPKEDAVCEMLDNLNDKQRKHAIRILNEFIQAVTYTSPNS